ncbi:MAG: hypothetical protein LBJ90_06295, partial [Treponema sp.]|nr:hypothetical protein [Treponema sp.]
GFLSCGGEKPVDFPVSGFGGGLAGLSGEASSGKLDFSKPKKLEYVSNGAFPLPSASSLEIGYAFSAAPSPELKARLVLRIGEDSWALPADLAFLGLDAGADTVFHYAVPLGNSFPRQFSIDLLPPDSGAKNPPVPPPVFEIRSLDIKPRWFGFYRGSGAAGSKAAPAGEAHFFASPFVYRRRDGAFILDPPGERGGGAAGREARPEVLVKTEEAAGQSSGTSRGTSGALLETGGRRFELEAPEGEFRVPSGLTAPNSGPLVLEAGGVRAFVLDYQDLPRFPLPLDADPGIILDFPREAWRDPRYEVFRWEAFPSLLIFDTADYAVQDRLFKRLAFFTEKAGFRGRLASDGEIAGLHGWNAHDYSAEGLARFFDAARKSNFPLLAEERELEKILLASGLIRSGGGGISAGEGGIISISQESAPYLRRRFMAHEGFHGLFFIDEDFRNFSRGQWENLPRQAKRFLTSFFDFQSYDTGDDYLVVNEFMAHLLQQPLSQAGRYFGETLPNNMIKVSPWRRVALPEEEVSAGGNLSWPGLSAIFSAASESFSAYVSRRWGLAAGRVWKVSVSTPAD